MAGGSAGAPDRVGVSGLGPPLRQLWLWDVAAEKQRQLQEALGALRACFGDGVVRRASELGPRPGLPG